MQFMARHKEQGACADTTIGDPAVTDAVPQQLSIADHSAPATKAAAKVTGATLVDGPDAVVIAVPPAVDSVVDSSGPPSV